MPEIKEATFRFHAHRISKCDYSLIDGAPKLAMSYEIEPRLECGKTEDGIKFGKLSLELKVRGKHARKVFLKMDMTIEGKFSTEDKIDAEKFERLCIINGTAALLPILRGAIVTLTAQAGMNPPLKIPMVNVFKTFEK